MGTLKLYRVTPDAMQKTKNWSDHHGLRKHPKTPFLSAAAATVMSRSSAVSSSGVLTNSRIHIHHVAQHVDVACLNPVVLSFHQYPSNYCVVQIVASSEQQINQDQGLVTRAENQTENFIQPDCQE